MSSCSVTAPETPVQQPTEIRQYTMDFSNLLSGTETIASITSIASVLRGGGVSDLTVYNEAVDSDATGVEFWVSGGTNNSTYRIEIIVVTTAFQTFEGDGLLSIRDK